MNFSNLWGTSKSAFIIGLGALGVRLKNLGSGNGLSVRNQADNADLDITVKRLKNNDTSLELNADAANSGTDRKVTLSINPAASAALEIQFPAAKGTDGYVWAQKAGTAGGVLEVELVPLSSGANSVKTDTTDIVFGSSSPVTMFQLPANAVIDYVDTIVDEAFDGTAPTASVGVSGTASKYVPATEIDLKTVGQYRTYPSLEADGTAQDLIFTLAPDSSTTGAARVIVAYSIPA